MLYNTGIAKFLNTLFLLGPHLCFILDLISDLFVARNDLWMRKTPCVVLQLRDSQESQHVVSVESSSLLHFRLYL